ncbi:MAG: hypothetical protein LAQ30_16975, partial [Acidobacteriia bacterium]|nr:hypothetical protein [Terriglobia bacterium]
QEKIEAVYTFPLPPGAAVDSMTMLVGDRTIRGLIKPREEARRIYDDARRAGKVAGLLDQDRPNVFTQAVANIMPGARVNIEISYVETVPYEAGAYEFTFPMVVGPRYIPGAPTGKQGGGWAPDTNQVPDASRITPPVTPEGTRAGHDISLEVALDAGVPIESLAAKTHDIAIERPNPRQAVVRLRRERMSVLFPSVVMGASYLGMGSGIHEQMAPFHDRMHPQGVQRLERRPRVRPAGATRST